MTEDASAPEGLDRRTLIKRLALGAAFATPVISSFSMQRAFGQVAGPQPPSFPGVGQFFAPTTGSNTTTTGGGVVRAQAPRVAGVNPNAGRSTGGTVVTVVGSGLNGTTKVLFGTEPGTNVTVASDSSLTVTSPAHQPAKVNVFVVAIGVKSKANSADAFTFHPFITSVSPTSGTHLGGKTVTISGGGFTGASQVHFGPFPAQSFTVVSDSEIQAVTPATSAPGTANVRVVTNGVTSPVVTADRYRFT